ncbi:YggS family pyridoxal phosphate-dependent enzyme [Ornithinimicrobium sp. Arc0846-15]|nr:YggS family pyridoxal phosphate-dependent enzyme [Ornithinimicrobium laminariae]
MSELSQDERRHQVQQGLAAVQGRITQAVQAAGRDSDDVALIAVTKFFPLSDCQLLLEMGQVDFGESRDQEASEKIPDLRDWAQARGDNGTSDSRPFTTHFVGQVQSKKARSLARYVDVVHSVDRPKLVTALDRAVQHACEAGERSEGMGALIQVNFDSDAAADRGGVSPSEVPALAEKIARSDHLRLLGLMAVAPQGAQGQEAQEAFDSLAAACHDLKQVYPQANWMSAGMSGDLEEAINAGATHLRVGGAILGSRYPGR